MRPRIIKLSVSVMGMARMPIATIHIKKYSDELEPVTELLCPACKSKPKWNGGYDCNCGAHYNHWSKLLRVNKATGEPVVKPRLLGEEAEVFADLYVMSLEDFSRYVDATKKDYGITVNDETSARNLKKLIIATEKLSKVILVRYNDTFEEVVSILTLSLSGRIILKDIIPLNLLDAEETMSVNMSEVTSQELAEAEAFVKMLPEAKEELLNVKDYRAIGVSEMRAPKVIKLEAIIPKG